MLHVYFFHPVELCRPCTTRTFIFIPLVRFYIDRTGVHGNPCAYMFSRDPDQEVEQTCNPSRPVNLYY